jgi:hypothetical protein
MDEEIIDSSSYEHRSGSLIIDLKPDYLETLSVGKHTIHVTFSDGSASAKITIKEKSSGGGSSEPDQKAEPAAESDGAVTCQMAGYPENYAWNEAAHACQPGYLDNSGVFHPAASSGRTGVVNTYDPGVGGHMASLIVSVITALTAAFVLKHF